MNAYARLEQVRAELNGPGHALDAQILSLMEMASRVIDRECQRQFFASVETRYFDGLGEPRLVLNADLASASSVQVDANDDGTFEYTLAANTDYWLYPDNRPSHAPSAWAIELHGRSGAQLSVWPYSRRAVKVTGTWGYSYETEAAGQLAAALTDSATEVVLDAGHSVMAGATLVIGSEQMDVTAVVAERLTVQRAINGTTAAAHLDDAAVSVVRYPRPIEQACALQTVRMAWESQGGYAGSLQASETYAAAGPSRFSQLYPAIRDMVAPYHAWWGVL